MAKFLVRRFVFLLFTMLFISMVIFAISELAPGDVVRHMLGAFATPEQEESLREQGAFIGYEGKELAIPAPSEAQTTEEPDKMSMMGVITLALDIEREAKGRYEAMAEQTSDPSGKAMFERLAEEEQEHYVILRDAYWSLNDHGVWVWPKK